MGWFNKGIYKFEIFTDDKQEFRFRMKAPNGEIILTSEGYKQLNSAYDTLNVIIKNAKRADIECLI
jgi:uncharacterized protein